MACLGEESCEVWEQWPVVISKIRSEINMDNWGHETYFRDVTLGNLSLPKEPWQSGAWGAALGPLVPSGGPELTLDSNHAEAHLTHPAGEHRPPSPAPPLQIVTQEVRWFRLRPTSPLVASTRSSRGRRPRWLSTGTAGLPAPGVELYALAWKTTQTRAEVPDPLGASSTVLSKGLNCLCLSLLIHKIVLPSSLKIVLNCEDSLRKMYKMPHTEKCSKSSLSLHPYTAQKLDAPFPIHGWCSLFFHIPFFPLMCPSWNSTLPLKFNSKAITFMMASFQLDGIFPLALAFL